VQDSEKDPGSLGSADSAGDEAIRKIRRPREDVASAIGAEPRPRNMLAYKSLRGTAASDHLDFVRGTAALAVLCGHLRSHFIVSYSDIVGKPNPLVKFLFLVTGFPHYAVMMFFVLSGFLVGGTVLRGRMDGKFSWSPYAVNRLTRLWVVLIPALLLGAFWDHLGIHLFGTSGIYGGLPKTNAAMVPIPPRLSAGAMLGNAFFLQGILAPTFGSNGPLWSLSYEFWYYVLFPLIVLAFPLGRAGWSNVLYAIASFIVLFFIGQSISIYFLIWLLGAAINFAPERSGRSGELWIAAIFGALMLVLALFKSQLDPIEHSDFVVGVASAVLIYVLLQSNAPSTSGIYSRTARTLAGFSYTLYLVHAPALNFIGAWLAPGASWQPDAIHIAAVASLGICMLAYAFGIAQLTEYRTSAIRSRVTAALGSIGNRAT
jgi:peptidoglycan/LPS O-acetylase OafA/YrhL